MIHRQLLVMGYIPYCIELTSKNPLKPNMLVVDTPGRLGSGFGDMRVANRIPDLIA